MEKDQDLQNLNENWIFNKLCENVEAFSFSLYKNYKKDQWLLEKFNLSMQQKTFSIQEVKNVLELPFAQQTIWYFEESANKNDVLNRINSVVYLSMLANKKFTKAEHITLVPEATKPSTRYFGNGRDHDVLLMPFTITRLAIPASTQDADTIKQIQDEREKRGFSRDWFFTVYDWLRHNDVNNISRFWIEKFSHLQAVTDSNPEIVWKIKN